jgi:hypothetical protein
MLSIACTTMKKKSLLIYRFKHKLSYLKKKFKNRRKIYLPESGRLACGGVLAGGTQPAASRVEPVG